LAESVAVQTKAKGTASKKSSNKLQEIRVQEGLSLAALAKLSEINERTIRDIENGRRPGRDVTLHRLVNAINGNPKRISKREYTFDEVFPSNQPLLF
jgi:transcriptional regulator with XRE-family HTH domain